MAETVVIGRPMSVYFGKGRPVRFECAKCRKDPTRAGIPDDVEPTGRVRRLSPSRGKHDRGIGVALYETEYKCLYCGHIGWSRHSTLARRQQES